MLVILRVRAHRHCDLEVAERPFAIACRGMAEAEAEMGVVVGGIELDNPGELLAGPGLLPTQVQGTGELLADRGLRRLQEAGALQDGGRLVVVAPAEQVTTAEQHGVNVLLVHRQPPRRPSRRRINGQLVIYSRAWQLSSPSGPFCMPPA